MDPSTGAPTNKLTEEAVKILSSLGSSSTTVTDIIDKKDEVVYAAIQKAIDSTNEQAVSNAQKVNLICFQYIFLKRIKKIRSKNLQF